MKATLKHPTMDALTAYARRVMRDGKPRVAVDLVNRAADDGMVVTLHRAGKALGRLEGEGVLELEMFGDTRIWQMRQPKARAAQ